MRTKILLKNNRPKRKHIHSRSIQYYDGCWIHTIEHNIWQVTGSLSVATALSSGKSRKTYFNQPLRLLCLHTPCGSNHNLLGPRPLWNSWQWVCRQTRSRRYPLRWGWRDINTLHWSKWLSLDTNSASNGKKNVRTDKPNVGRYMTEKRNRNIEVTLQATYWTHTQHTFLPIK